MCKVEPVQCMAGRMVEVEREKRKGMLEVEINLQCHPVEKKMESHYSFPRSPPGVDQMQQLVKGECEEA